MFVSTILLSWCMPWIMIVFVQKSSVFNESELISRIILILVLARWKKWQILCIEWIKPKVSGETNIMDIFIDENYLSFKKKKWTTLRKDGCQNEFFFNINFVGKMEFLRPKKLICQRNHYFSLEFINVFFYSAAHFASKIPLHFTSTFYYFKWRWNKKPLAWLHL